MKNAIVKWDGNMSFDVDVDDHAITIDAAPEVGGMGKGPRPKPLLLVALAGCTGMDVASLMKKMRVDATDFNVEVNAEMTDEHPKYYNKIHITYTVKGNHLDLAKIEKAVNLSLTKYCGVHHMLAQVAEVTHNIELN